MGSYAQALQHKQALSDQELQNKVGEIIQNRNNIQAKLPSLQQGTPDYDQAMAALQQSAHDLRDLYHPAKNPNAIQKFGHLLTDHIGLTNPLQRDQQRVAKGVAGIESDQRSAQSLAAAAPLSTQQQMNSQIAAIQNSPLSDEDKQKAMESLYKIYQKPNLKFMKLPDGRIEPYDANDPSSIPEGAIPYTNPTVGTTEVAQYNEGVANGTIPPTTSLASYLSSAKGKMTGPQLLQDSYLATLKMPSNTPWSSLSDTQRAGYELYVNNLKQRYSTHQAQVTDRDGIVHIIDLSSTSGPAQSAPPTAPVASPNGGSPAPPKANGAGGSGAPSGKGSKVLDFKKSTPTYTKASNDVLEARGLASFADQVATKPNDAVNQKRLAAALEKISAGRFTTQALDYIMKAGWGNTIDQWVHNPTTGALPPDVLRQLVDGAHENLTAKLAAQKALDTAPDSGQNGGGQPKHYVGETVTLKNGTKVKISVVHPDGSFE